MMLGRRDPSATASWRAILESLEFAGWASTDTGDLAGISLSLFGVGWRRLGASLHASGTTGRRSQTHSSLFSDGLFPFHSDGAVRSVPPRNSVLARTAVSVPSRVAWISDRPTLEDWLVCCDEQYSVPGFQRVARRILRTWRLRQSAVNSAGGIRDLNRSAGPPGPPQKWWRA
jgi:hypothetical protein